MLPPADRLEAIAAALRGQMDEEEGEEEQLEVDEVEEVGQKLDDHITSSCKTGKTRVTVLLGKDAQELRVVQALAFMSLHRWEEALKTWRRLAAFTCHHCPPFDEALAVYATQAALCTMEMKKEDVSNRYVLLALEAHAKAFGVAGASFFQWRYRREVEESLVSQQTKEAFLREAATAATAAASRSFSEAVKAWSFEDDEMSAAYETFS